MTLADVFGCIGRAIGKVGDLAYSGAKATWNWYHNAPFALLEKATVPAGVLIGSGYALERGLNYVNDNVDGDWSRAGLAAGATLLTIGVNVTFNKHGFTSRLYNNTLVKGLNYLKNKIPLVRRLNDLEEKEWRSPREVINDWNDRQKYVPPQGFFNKLSRYGKTLALLGLVGSAVVGTSSGALKNYFKWLRPIHRQAQGCDMVEVGTNIRNNLESFFVSPLADDLTSRFHDYGSREIAQEIEDIQDKRDLELFIRTYGIKRQDLDYLTRVQRAENPRGSAKERGAIMRVALNRANNPRIFPGDTIEDVVSSCSKKRIGWNCKSKQYMRHIGDRKRGLARYKINEKYVKSALRFLFGVGDEGLGATMCNGRDGFVHRETQERLEREIPEWNKENPRKIGTAHFSGPGYGSKPAEYPPVQRTRKKGDTVLVIGDSHIVGFGGKALEPRLKLRYDRVIMAGLEGARPDNFAYGNPNKKGQQYKFEDLVDKYDPDTVIISLGTNCNNAGGVKKKAVRDLVGIVPQGTQCYWVGAPAEKSDNVDAEDVNDRLREVMPSQCTFIDPTEFTSGTDVNTKDGYHLTHTGGQRFAKGVMDEL